jgi:hypothetical protein
MTHKKEDPKFTIQFAPGAFDDFQGTQEELDDFVAQITAQAASGELLSQSEPVNLEDLFDEDPEMALTIAKKIGLFDDLDDETLESIMSVLKAPYAIESTSILERLDGVLDDDLFDCLPKKRRLN